jgi:DNA-directed RNA polymerase
LKPTDFDRSLDRVARNEEARARASGFGTTRQGQAMARQYLQPLAASIAAERAHGRDKDVWRALKGIKTDDLALRLLIAGITVCWDDGLGINADGEKTFRDVCLFIGRDLGQRTTEAAFRVGAWGARKLEEAVPYFAVNDAGVLIIDLTDELDADLTDIVERSVKNNPLLSPLTTPPTPWTQVETGGLPPDHWAKVPLIREHHPSIKNAARKAISTGQMQPVLDAINALQAVPLKINRPILDFMLRNEVPPVIDPKAIKPKQWEARSRFQTLEATKITAEIMSDCDRFWVPHNIDFRGRLYGIPHLNFQREDRVRGLFLFADGEPIGEDGLLWLKAHVAARADKNKWSKVEKPGELNFADRVAWTDAHLEDLCEIGNAVLRGDDPKSLAWALPGKPYQFLAACIELVLALEQGPQFETRLPLTFDGSCSGLQHLCMMTRADEGRYVNLTPADESDDFYRRVAYRVWWKNPALQYLMEGPFDRKIVKQPCMTFFYGSKPGGFSKDKADRWQPFGMTEQIVKVLKEREQSTKGAKELAHAIYKVIEDMVPKAKQVRDSLKRLAEEYAAKGKSLRWTTPLGLPVFNAYYPAETKEINTTINNRRRRVTLAVGDKPEIDSDGAKNAATANYVHSMDAAHMQMTILAAAKEGIEMVAVHDCFGTIASRTARFHQIIIEQFVRLYKDCPPPIEGLAEFGNLNIEDVSPEAFK